MQPTHPWKAKLGVGVAMIVLAFLGIAFTDMQATAGWDFWKWIVPVYAILALWLSWYVKRKEQTISPITIWHELFHWTGVIGSIFFISYLVHLGTISRLIAGIFDLILLGLGVFLAGIYIEPALILVGLILWIFAVLTAVLVQYMYPVFISIAVAGVIIASIAVWISHKKFKRHPKNPKNS
jgi:hypothetical protein